MFRVWIAGPRSWEAQAPIERLIKKLESRYGIANLLVMTGGAPGVDRLVEGVCYNRGIHVFACRACWPVGRHAGPVRNSVIAREFSPKLLVALHYYPLESSNHPGTRSAIKNAQSCGILVKTVHVPAHIALPSSVADNSPMGNKARAEQGLPPRPPKAVRNRAKAHRKP